MNIQELIDKIPIEQAIGIAVVFFIAFVAQFFSKRIIQNVVRQSVRSSKFATKRDEMLREDTLISILYTTIRVGIWIAAVLLSLSIFDINIGPLLAGAGIVGVALGFGAQTMVKDFLAGIFILAENQYRVGDVVEINQTVSGVVERITLRMTVLRNLEGMVHYIPNGTIDIATNLTMDYANVELNIGVGYSTDIDHVENVINKVGVKLFQDPEWKDVALEAPHMLRLDGFADSALTIKILCKTAPSEQWAVKGELLRRLKKEFDKEGIEIPFPQVVVHGDSPRKK
jgi:moderate conductance mechanosensitive channel